jgi:hypothetical protein
MFKKIKEFMKNKKDLEYIKNISINHPEIENYGLNCDTKLYVEFNKEKLIRQFVGFERLIQNKMSEVCGINVPYNESEPSEAERFYAQCKILVFVDMGILNKENLEVIKNMEILV